MKTKSAYYCTKCRNYFPVTEHNETDNDQCNKCNIKQEWQDENRTYTIIERVYATRIDCIDTQLAAA